MLSLYGAEIAGIRCIFRDPEIRLARHVSLPAFASGDWIPAELRMLWMDDGRMPCC